MPTEPLQPSDAQNNEGVLPDPIEAPIQSERKDSEEVPTSVLGEITSESQLPPEAQGDVNGGPLGCCVGVTVGILFSVSIALFARIYPDTLNGFFLANLRVIMACAGLLGMAVCGRIGWRVGKRFYKEYDPPVVERRRYRKKTPRR